VWIPREVFDEDFIQALNNSLDQQKLNVSSPEAIQQIKEKSSTLDADHQIEQQEKTAAAFTSSLTATASATTSVNATSSSAAATTSSPSLFSTVSSNVVSNVQSLNSIQLLPFKNSTYI
jgi:hypothetical protein